MHNETTYLHTPTIKETNNMVTFPLQGCEKEFPPTRRLMNVHLCGTLSSKLQMRKELGKFIEEKEF